MVGAAAADDDDERMSPGTRAWLEMRLGELRVLGTESSFDYRAGRKVKADKEAAKAAAGAGAAAPKRSRSKSDKEEGKSKK